MEKYFPQKEVIPEVSVHTEIVISDTVSPEMANLPTDIENTSTEIEDTPAEIENTPAEIENTPAEIENTPAEIENTPAEIQEPTVPTIATTVSNIDEDDSTVVNTSILPDFKWKEKIKQLLPEIRLPDIGSAAIGNIPFQDIFANVSTSIAGIAKNAVWIFIYLLFLFMESKHFSNKMDKIQRNNPILMHKMLPAMTQINHDLIEYIKVKTVASVATGFLSFIVLSIFGVDFASFWGFVIFILNYIPTVGSIVAVIFPILLAFVQFDTVAPVFGLTGLLIAIQFLIGNFLEPRFLGKTLNLSPLVILISLGVWGKIWGVIGMFLSVPIMVSLNIILAQFEQTRNIAIFLSANGNIRINKDDEEEK